MVSDFDEFCDRVGRDVPVYRACMECGDVTIINPDTYGKPKTVCDPGYCENQVPFCICLGTALCTEHAVKKCKYPDCEQSARPDDE